MGAIFSGPPDPPPLPPMPAQPTKEDPAVEEARRKELIAAQKTRGRAATLLTGGEGDTTDAPVQTKRLLGE